MAPLSLHEEEETRGPFMLHEDIGGSPQARRRVSPEIDHVGTLISGCQLPALLENEFLFFKPSRVWYSITGTQAD